MDAALGRLKWIAVGMVTLAVMAGAAKAGKLSAQGPGSANPGPAYPRTQALQVPADLRAAKEGYMQVLDSLRQKYHIPGMGVSVVLDGKIILAEGLGYRNVELKHPATAQTPFEVASLTKCMAATVIMQLVEEGVLNLDSTLYRYFPNYEDYCRRAALSRNPYLYNYCCRPSCHNTLRNHLSHTALGNTPGNEFMYNGVLFGLLRPIIEKATEQDFVRAMRERILWQADMKNTVVCGTDGSCPKVQQEMAGPYRWDGRTRHFVKVPNSLGGPSSSAGVISTAEDLAKFDIALDRSLLIPKSRATAWALQRNDRGDTLIYGLGWFLQPNSRSGPSPKLVWHYGWLPDGYSALYLKVPDLKLTLILLANSEGLAAPFNLINGDVRRSPFALEFLRRFAGYEGPGPDVQTTASGR